MKECQGLQPCGVYFNLKTLKMKYLIKFMLACTLPIAIPLGILITLFDFTWFMAKEIHSKIGEIVAKK